MRVQYTVMNMGKNGELCMRLKSDTPIPAAATLKKNKEIERIAASEGEALSMEEMNNLEQAYQKKIKIIFCIRILMWIICAAGCIYWIYWSFELYRRGIYDVHEYGPAFRPHFRLGLMISACSLTVSIALRITSDALKRRFKRRLDIERVKNYGPDRTREIY